MVRGIPPEARTAAGMTLIEICVVVVLAGLLTVGLARLTSHSLGWSNREVGRSAAQAAFTLLSDSLQRDLGGTLPALPLIKPDSIEIVPSDMGATVSYRFEPLAGQIMRTDPTGKVQDFRFIGKPGETSRFNARLIRESGQDSYALAVKLTPNASFPTEVFERSFLFRYTGFSGAFFQGDRPLPLH